MDLIFRGKHLTLHEEFRDYARKRLDRVGRYLPVAQHAIVDVRREAKGADGRFVVQVTLNVNGTYLRAEERNHQLNAAVDAAADVLARQVKRFKEKHYRSERRASKEERMPVAGTEEQPSIPPDAELVAGRVVKVKRFALKPMTEAEAIEQMELLGHSFFVFQDADRDCLSVLYRRRDGDYGMILPETP